MTCNSQHTHGLGLTTGSRGSHHGILKLPTTAPAQCKPNPTCDVDAHARSISSHNQISQQSDIEQAQVQHQTEKFSHPGHVSTQDPNKGEN